MMQIYLEKKNDRNKSLNLSIKNFNHDLFQVSVFHYNVVLFVINENIISKFTQPLHFNMLFQYIFIFVQTEFKTGLTNNFNRVYMVFFFHIFH